MTRALDFIAMNSVLKFLMTLSLLGAAVAPTPQDTPPKTNTALAMTAAVKSQPYCLIDPDNPPHRGDHFGNVFLNLTIRIENVSNRNVILCKTGIEDDGAEFRKAGSNGGPGEFIPELIVDRYGYEKVSAPNRPDNNYVILAPEQSYATEISTGRVVNLESENPYNANKGILFNGKYFFQATVMTWWQPPTVTSKLKLRWKRFGDLSDDVLTSQLIPIEINFPNGAPMCSN